MKKISIGCIWIIALVVLTAWASNVLAYSDYYNGCDNCHGDFFVNYVSNTAQDGVDWSRSLHSGHQTFAGCMACHQSIGDVPSIGGPSGDGYGSCMGCHGREEDANNLGVGSGYGAGLRQHHWVNGIQSQCVGCHADSNPANFSPVGEDVPGARNANQERYSCNDAEFGNFGSDNDGDNLYDENDSDCAPPPVCGNGTVESGEQCDDGNTIDGDGCQGNCQDPFCGDGILDPEEQCDDGNNTNGDGCQADCLLPFCGDSILDPEEQCDDGNSVSGDGCESDCTLTPPEPFCGDGSVDPGEACDDGNTSNIDACLNTCETATCGDGFIQAGAEACDDGNNVSGDGCESNCTLTPPPADPVCGDGIVNGNEECDNGVNNGNGCENDCTLPVSGGCSETDLPVVTEMEYNRGDKKLHLHGRAAAGTSITILNVETGETLSEGLRTRGGEWETKIKDDSSSLDNIRIASSNGCSIDLWLGDDTENSEHQEDDEEHEEESTNNNRRGRGLSPERGKLLND